MCGAYLLGELVGFTLESSWRASFLELHDRDLHQLREEADSEAYRRRAEAEEARLSAAKEAAIDARERMASEKEAAIAEKELAWSEKDAATAERHRLELENACLRLRLGVRARVRLRVELGVRDEGWRAVLSRGEG